MRIETIGYCNVKNENLEIKKIFNFINENLDLKKNQGWISLWELVKPYEKWLKNENCVRNKSEKWELRLLDTVPGQNQSEIYVIIFFRCYVKKIQYGS